MSRDPHSDLYPAPVPGQRPPLPAIEVKIPGRGLTVTGLMFAAVGLVTIVGGIVGVFFGVFGQRKGDPLGKWAIILSAMSVPAAIALFVIIDATGIAE